MLESTYTLVDSFMDETRSTAHMFYNAVQYCGERPAQKFMANGAYQTLTYNEYAAIVEDLANGLLALGVNKGDMLGIMSHTVPAWDWTDYAIRNAGAVVVTLYPSILVNEVKYIVNHSEMVGMFVGDEETLEKVMLCLPESPSLKYLVIMNNDYKSQDPRVLNLRDLCSLGQDYKLNHPHVYEERWYSLSREDPCTLIYTSGTTGTLKGCLLSHKNVIAGTYAFIKRLEQGGWIMNYNDTLFSILPMAHVWERVNNHSVCIAIGGLTGFGEKPATIIRDLQALKPTLMILVTRLWDRLFNGIKTAICASPEGQAKFEWAIDIGSQVLEKRMNTDGAVNMHIDPLSFLKGQLRDDFEKANNEVFSIFRNALGGNVRASGSGGAIMPADLQHDIWAMNFPLIDGWGLTESAAGANISMASDVKSGCLAKEFCPRVEGKLAEDGEILLRGNGVITEYFKNPEETAASFTPDGWFKTGDIGVYENGYLRIADRKKAILVLDTGKNVSPANIELKFTNSTVIEQIVIVGDNEKYISALIVPYYDNIIRIFQEKGLPVDESELIYAMMNGMNTCIHAGSLAKHPYLQELIKAEIDQVNVALNDFERIRKYTILPGKLLEEKGQLTPTLKVKTKVVCQDFAQEIKTMYE